MDRTRLNYANDLSSTAEQGFTLVEALVGMMVFTIGFSGLFLFFNISQQVVTEAQTRLHLHFIAGQIVDAISANAKRSTSDPLNPFVSAASYSGSLANCSYPVADDRQLWCLQLNSEVGALNPVSGKEIRDIAIINDGTGLIINVSFVARHGAVSVYYTRKIRQI